MSKNSSTKTNAGMVEYARVQIGLGYWYGCFGQKGSLNLLREKSQQYPSMYEKWDRKTFEAQFGQRVHDCAGLVKGYLWSETPTSTPKYNASQDLSAKGFYQRAKVRGPISTFDKVDGRLVFKGSSPDQIHHVGIYSAKDNTVIEAKGHAYGVVKSPFNSTWTYWAQCVFIEESVKPEPTGTKYSGPWPTLPKRGHFQRGDKGTEVVKLQRFLKWFDPSLLPKYGADGSIGSETIAAVKEFQAKTKIKVDGLFGKNSLATAKAYRR